MRIKWGSWLTEASLEQRAAIGMRCYACVMMEKFRLSKKLLVQRFYI
jgi:hypothetical protein